MSAETKHTPGPLTYAETTGGYTIRSESVGKGYFSSVGHATQRDPNPQHGGGISHETAEANARLWSTAPDLLEALRRARSYVSMLCEEGHRLASRADLDAVDAAIAKAEGREP